MRLAPTPGGTGWHWVLGDEDAAIMPGLGIHHDHWPAAPDWQAPGTSPRQTDIHVGGHTTRRTADPMDRIAAAFERIAAAAERVAAIIEKETS